MTYTEFCQAVHISKLEIYRESFAAQKPADGNGRRIKKEKTADKNLDTIFSAVLKISNKKGFNAMSMRDLSRECGLSMGALYNYFSGKDELLEMLQHQQRTLIRKILAESIAAETDPATKLRAAITTHLYLSEAMQPWFYFSYMETKNLSQTEKRKAIDSELATEKMFCDILTEGQKQNVFHEHDPQIGACIVKAMLQDWYLKRGKYANKQIAVDDYTAYVLDVVTTYFLKTAPPS